MKCTRSLVRSLSLVLSHSICLSLTRALSHSFPHTNTTFPPERPLVDDRKTIDVKPPRHRKSYFDEKCTISRTPRYIRHWLLARYFDAFKSEIFYPFESRVAKYRFFVLFCFSWIDIFRPSSHTPTVNLFVAANASPPPYAKRTTRLSLFVHTDYPYVFTITL